jgi:hypothetical protein
LSIPFLPHLPNHIFGRRQAAVAEFSTEIGADAKYTLPPIIRFRLI